MKQTKLSILELAVLKENGNFRNAIDETVKVAQHAESLGYSRIWLAEHHNSASIACSATVLLIELVASHTQQIRVGSGGIMLPNHAPLIIAEQFGTLETLFPGRIDLGLGRAPGTDQATARAIRRRNMEAHFDFPEDVQELQRYLSREGDSPVHAFPGEGSEIPLWILGSSTDSAYVAAEMGLPYTFAAHFAPSQMDEAFRIYKNRFRPSRQLKKPYAMACVNVIGADSDEEAQWQSTSLQRLFLSIITGDRHPLMPPHSIPNSFTQHPQVMQHLNMMTAGTFIGSEETLRKKLNQFIDKTEIDELMITSYLFKEEDKLKSLEIARQALNR